MNNKKPDFSKEQIEYLKLDEFINSVIDKREKPIKQKSFWLSIIESSTGAALATVLFGGIVTGFITYQYQVKHKERDFGNKTAYLYIETMLERKKEIVKEQISLISDSLNLLGSIESKVTSRIEIDGRKFAKRINKDQELLNNQQKIKIRKKFNEIWEIWDTKKKSLSVLIEYYFENETFTGWNELVNDVDKLIICGSNHRPSTNDKKCKDELMEFIKSTNNFKAILSKNNTSNLKIDSSVIQEIKNMYEL